MAGESLKVSAYHEAISSVAISVYWRLHIMSKAEEVAEEGKAVAAWLLRRRKVDWLDIQWKVSKLKYWSGEEGEEEAIIMLKLAGVSAKASGMPMKCAAKKTNPSVVTSVMLIKILPKWKPAMRRRKWRRLTKAWRAAEAGEAVWRKLKSRLWSRQPSMVRRKRHLQVAKFYFSVHSERGYDWWAHDLFVWNTFSEKYCLSESTDSHSLSLINWPLNVLCSFWWLQRKSTHSLQTSHFVDTFGCENYSDWNSVWNDMFSEKAEEKATAASMTLSMYSSSNAVQPTIQMCNNGINLNVYFCRHLSANDLHQWPWLSWWRGRRNQHSAKKHCLSVMTGQPVVKMPYRICWLFSQLSASWNDGGGYSDMAGVASQWNHIQEWLFLAGEGYRQRKCCQKRGGCGIIAGCGGWPVATILITALFKHAARPLISAGCVTWWRHDWGWKLYSALLHSFIFYAMKPSSETEEMQFSILTVNLSIFSDEWYSTKCRISAG